MDKRVGEVFIVGGGPGDPGLVTLRAAHLLQTADVLLYDALVSDAVVAMAGSDCEAIFVGKRGGNHALPQREIEALMIRKAREGNRVVRLKGGDPFVFGRGAEEAQILREAGIPFSIVPGITSAIAAPAYAGIPMTHRDCNTSFTIVTGHEDPSKPESTIDWHRLADPHQTVVLLMAMGNLHEVTARLIAAGLPPDRPAAIVMNGTRPSQRTVCATLQTIAAEAEKANVGAPAIVVVGDVVALRDEIAWYERAPLFGKRVLVTRPAHLSDAFARALVDAGAQPVPAATIRIVAPADARASRAAVERSAEYDWIVFTSVNGVSAFFETLEMLRRDARVLCAAKIAAIGRKTAQALAGHGLRADLIPAKYVAEDLADALIAASQAGDRILLYRAADARDVLPERLRAADRIVEDTAAYASEVCTDPSLPAKTAQCDILTFTSAGTVRGFVENFPDALSAAAAAASKIVACIGPITADAARAFGLHVDVVAEEFTVEGLQHALERALAATP